jgi:Holliday junction resolvase RusA-like endonuclease
VVVPKAGSKSGRRAPFATVFTDEKTRDYEKSVKDLATAAMAGAPPLQGALAVCLRFRLEPPKSMTKRERAAVLSGEQPYLGAFDVDNLAKAVLDGCNEVCWGDDKQIVRLLVMKVASEQPGVDVRVERLG